MRLRVKVRWRLVESSHQVAAGAEESLHLGARCVEQRTENQALEGFLLLDEYPPGRVQAPRRNLPSTVSA